MWRWREAQITQKCQPEGHRYVCSPTRLVAEDAGWVGAGGAPGGEEAGGQGSEGHYYECGGEGCGVAWAHLKEEIAEQARQYECYRGAEEDAAGG